MKLTLCAVGKLGATVENNLVKDYLNRASLTGRGLAFHRSICSKSKPEKARKPPPPPC